MEQVEQSPPSIILLDFKMMTFLPHEPANLFASPLIHLPILRARARPAFLLSLAHLGTKWYTITV